MEEILHLMNDSNNLPIIDGINIESAMSYLDDNLELFNRLLKKFIIMEKNTVHIIWEYLEKESYEDAWRKAHTLKGFAGNLGAEELYLCAYEAEQSIKNQENYDTALQRLDEVLKLQSKAINDYIEGLDENVINNCNSVEQNKSVKFNELIAYLENSDIKSVECFKEFLTTLNNKPKEIFQIEQLIESFDFDKALTMIKLIKTKLLKE